MRSNPSKAARALIALLCALLLFGQQAGLSHAVWHAAGTVAHAGHGSEGEQHDAESGAQRELCAFHAALGTTLGGHCGETAAFALCAAGVIHELREYPGRTTPEAVPAVSRGPPVSL